MYDEASLARRSRRRPRTRELLLYDRVAEVRTELIEIAAILERFDDPDPAAVALLHDLLADGCGSPLYNPDVHVSELRATLYYVRSALETAPLTTKAAYAGGPRGLG
ncbi:MAG: hypothetical protein ACXVE9_04875 [Solirubrobacteraceae bacterium]